MSTLSVVYRGTGFGRITREDYEEAIEELRAALTQLEPDGDNCHVCHDSGHQAWECHHNPLVMARRAAGYRDQWRCFHCGQEFKTEEGAREHFGPRSTAEAACLLPYMCITCCGHGYMLNRITPISQEDLREKLANRASAEPEIIDPTKIVPWFKLYCETCGQQEGNLVDLHIEGHIPDNKAKCPKCGVLTSAFHSGTYSILIGR